MTRIPYKRLVLLIALYAGLIAFLLVTNPNKLTIGWLILPFVWLFCNLFLTALVFMDIFGYKYRSKKRLGVTLLVALIPTIILILDSVNQLTLRDCLLITIVGLLAVFYIGKLQPHK